MMTQVKAGEALLRNELLRMTARGKKTPPRMLRIETFAALAAATDL
jgi:hypothetical protein